MSRLSDRMLWYSIQDATQSAQFRRYRKTRLPTAALWTIAILLIVGWVIFK